MIPKHLKGYAFTKLRARVVIFTTFSFILLSLSYYNDTSISNEAKEKQGFKLLQETLENLKNKLRKSEASLKLWNEKVKRLHSDRTGLKIKQSKPIVDELKKANDINNLVINFSNPELRADFADAKFASVAYSDVTVSFSAFNDVDATRFINSLTHELQGHMQIKSLTMTAAANIDDILLANLAAGQFFDVVTVKMEAIWQDIIDKNAILQTGKKNENPADQNKTKAPQNPQSRPPAAKPASPPKQGAKQ